MAWSCPIAWAVVSIRSAQAKMRRDRGSSAAGSGPKGSTGTRDPARRSLAKAAARNKCTISPPASPPSRPRDGHRGRGGAIRGAHSFSQRAKDAHAAVRPLPDLRTSPSARGRAARSIHLFFCVSKGATTSRSSFPAKNSSAVPAPPVRSSAACASASGPTRWRHRDRAMGSRRTAALRDLAVRPRI
jgi:hypothetical protein